MMQVQRRSCITWLRLLLCVVGVASTSLNAIGQYWPLRFAVTRADAIWLNTALIINKFDSASSQIDIGEFELYRSGAPANRMVFAPDSGYGRRYIGSNSPGSDSSLARNLQTTSFRYQQGDVLRFYRKLSVYMNCKVTAPSNPKTPQDAAALIAEPRLQYFGLSYYYSILDDTRFVLRLVDSATHQVLATIDSVGIPANGQSGVSHVYGTEPLTNNRQVLLPAAHANTAVYLRVDPYRFGTTPFGLGLSFVGGEISSSSCDVYLADRYYYPTWGDSLHRVRLDQYMNAQYQHYDSILASNGCVDEMETSILFYSDSVAYAFLSRYYDSVDVTTRPMQYLPRQCYASKLYAGQFRKTQTASMNIHHPARNGSEYIVNILVARAIPGLRVRVYEVASGRCVYTSPNCNSSSSCQHTLPNLPRGAYLFVLEDYLGVIETARTSM